MTNHDFIKNNIGNKVYVTGDGDLAFDGSLRRIISTKDYKVQLTIVKLTKGGMAYLVDEHGDFYTVPPRNVKEI